MRPGLWLLFGLMVLPVHASAGTDTLRVEMEDVTVSTTRSTRSIADIPTRVEVIAGEELVEKGNMRPGDLRMLLNEMTGITVRGEPGVLGESGIRMQGLPGRYTQVLKDGFPLFGGIGAGLGLLQTPPLDLAQVEIIKGPASTFHGAGAVAGLVNLVSRRPGLEPEWRLLVNGTSAAGADASAMFLNPGKRLGSSTYVQGGWQQAYDPSDEGFTALPRSAKTYIRQGLFSRPDAPVRFEVFGTWSHDDRTGGSMAAVEADNPAIGYLERTVSELKSVHAVVQAPLSGTTVRVRGGLSGYANRTYYDGRSPYRDRHTRRFAEITVGSGSGRNDWVVGSAVDFQKYGQSPEGGTTWSLFGNLIRDLTTDLMLESGYRLDRTRHHGTLHLPRMSLMWSPSVRRTYRLTGGMGYALPSLYANAPIIPASFGDPERVLELRPARSFGLTADANFRTESVNLNLMGFWSRVVDELAVDPVGPHVANAPQPLRAQGLETNLKWEHEPLALYLGHTYTVSNAELVSKHRLNTVLMIEEHEAWRVGLEAYYHGPQGVGKAYVIAGVMADYRIGAVTVFANLENLFDVRQTRFGQVYFEGMTPDSPGDVWTAPLYAPLDGRIANAGLRLEW